MSSGGKPIVILNERDAEDLGVRGMDRVTISYGNQKITAIVNITNTLVKKGEIGIYEELNHGELKQGTEVEVDVSRFPSSLQHIRERLKGRTLSYDEILEIIKDVVAGNLNDMEIASFVTTLHEQRVGLDEATSLSLAMVETGKRLELSRDIICDKHSIGGVPGDKTTLIVVPIIAASGLTIPKTSSRAITSAAGTADRAETLMDVEFELEELKGIVEKTNGCIVWGGCLHLAPADDIFIQVEYPLSIDPMLFPSIMSKKKAIGATHLVIDLPCGRGTKVKTVGDAELLAKDFIELGKRLSIKTNCAITYGEQPIGYTMGPVLEAREALEVLMRRKNVPDLIDKALEISGMLLEMTGKTNGKQLAMDILKSGKAEEKMREIILHQGGNNEIKPEDLEIGGYGFDYVSENNGIVLWIDNSCLVDIARAAGSPRSKGAGIHLYKKTGDPVKKGEKLFTVYAEKARKLERVRKIMEEGKPFETGSRMNMLIHKVTEPHLYRKPFILER